MKNVHTCQHRLANAHISLVIDGKANLLELKNLTTGHDYAGGQGLWRVIYAHDEVLEEEISAEDCDPEITAPTPTSLRIHYSSMKAVTGAEEAFSLTLLIHLNNDAFEFSATIANNATLNRIIREFNFPTIKKVFLAQGQHLFCGVNRIADIPAAIETHHSGYVADDNTGLNLPFCNEGFAVLANDVDGLYVGDHDPTFEVCSHLFRKRGGEIDAGIHKSPYLAAGQRRMYEGYVLAPYTGDWHVGAKKYRAWADSWFTPPVRPASIANGCNGWYRLIMRHQYGKILFRHDEMPRILKSMKETGIDTLFVFGWHRDGHDAGYPEYAYDESQGGKAALKEHFRQFRANGGKIILYFNGRLIDTATNFYRTRGKDLSIRGCDGQELIERYMFEGPGIDMRHQFGHKSFALACPHSGEWLGILKGFIDRAIELEVDGVFFDQLGFAERPCFGENHGHLVPMLDGRAVRMAQLRELHSYLKHRRSDMSFGIECISMFTCGLADYFHSYPGWNIASNDWLGKGEKPKLTTFIELFRYTFPEVLISDREIRDDTDIERRVNLALLRGLISDVEVHRCRSLIDEHAPLYKQYLTKANKLRDRFRHLIINGLYQDTDGASCDNKELSWSVFAAGEEVALVVTQSHLAETSATFEVPGYQLSEVASVSGDVRHAPHNKGFSVTLPRHALAVAVMRKA